jgi:hypothetical protein
MNAERERIAGFGRLEDGLHQAGDWYIWGPYVTDSLVGAAGRRPCFGGVERLQQDPEWKDNIVFSEYFHGDNAAGLGASHQTGWTGVIADVIRRRHGAVPSIDDVLAAIGPGPHS